MNKHSLLILSLFTAIFIDTLSGTLLGPLLPALFVAGPDSILAPVITNQTRYFLFGLTQGIVFIAMFFSSPILGDLSDQIGRKKILIVSLFGAFIGYLLSVAAVLMHNVTMLIISRFIAGLTAGSVSAAKAAVIDVSTDKNRTTNISYIIFAISLGCIAGPLISGILSNSHWVSWFHLTTPLYFAAIISFLNMVFLYIVFKEDYKPSSKKPIKLFSGLTSLVAAFKIPQLRGLSLTFLLMQFGWSIYIQFIALFLTLRYHFTPSEIGLFMTLTGIGFSLAFIYILKLLTNSFSLRKIAMFSIGTIVILLFGIVAIHNKFSAWIFSIPAATCLAISYSVLISLFSESVSKDQQGWVMGLTGSIGAFAFGLSGILAGLLVDFGAGTPIWVAVIILAMSAFSIYFTNTSKRE